MPEQQICAVVEIAGGSSLLGRGTDTDPIQIYFRGIEVYAPVYIDMDTWISDRDGVSKEHLSE